MQKMKAEMRTSVWTWLKSGFLRVLFSDNNVQKSHEVKQWLTTMFHRSRTPVHRTHTVPRSKKKYQSNHSSDHSAKTAENVNSRRRKPSGSKTWRGGGRECRALLRISWLPPIFSCRASSSRLSVVLQFIIASILLGEWIKDSLFSNQWEIIWLNVLRGRISTSNWILIEIMTWIYKWLW